MPQKKSNSHSKSSESQSRHSRSTYKFIPNLNQLKESALDLPDPELWPEQTFKNLIEVEGKMRSIEFSLKAINRGKESAKRWIYEGKVLIRKRDV